MTKVLIGFVTYGNWKYTSMMLDSLETAVNRVDKKCIIDTLGVVGKPEDEETVIGLQKKKINFIIHSENFGFPYSLNDIYQYGFVDNNYDYVIILGNDILLQKDSIKNLITTAVKYSHDFLSGTEISVNKYINLYPCVEELFDLKNNKKFLGNDLPNWSNVSIPRTEVIMDRNEEDNIGDTHNCSIFSRKCFESVGFVDTNFFPAYFSDNDYGRRMQLARLNMANSNKVVYFHFWSRTIYEENMRGTNDKYFPLNKKYYIEKWGGIPGKEKFSEPFNGDWLFGINIDNRDRERLVIEKWKSL